jgi:hypothetical protein
MIGDKLKKCNNGGGDLVAVCRFFYGCSYGMWRLAESPVEMCEDDEGHQNPKCWGP